MRQSTGKKIIGVAFVLSLVVLVTIASPRGTRAQGTEPGVTGSGLWTDPQTGQVFTRPGPGRVPFSPQAPPTEQPNSAIPALQQETHELKEQLQALRSANGLQYGAPVLRREHWFDPARHIPGQQADCAGRRNGK